MGLSLGDVAGEVFLRIDSVEGLPKLKKTGVYEILKASFDVITQAVSAGEPVSISYFGKFTPYIKAARKARNPHTGLSVSVPEKTVVKFRPSSALRESALSALGNLKESSKKEEKKPLKKKKKK